MNRPHAPAVVLVLVVLLSGCATSGPPEDPLGELASTEVGPRRQHAALEALDTGPPDEAYLETLHGIIWKPGYTLDVRVAALERLKVHDLEELKKTLRRYLPRLTARDALARYAQTIADEGWVELTPALVSSWARPMTGVADLERPEYLALVRLHDAGGGSGGASGNGATRTVADVVFDLLVETRSVSGQGLRTRCWTLLHRLGARDRLVQMLATRAIDTGDAFLVDLQIGARELGMVPYNREEIIWMRKLRAPERQAFWDDARSALAGLDPARRASLDLRDVAIVVAAARHDPDLLTATTTSLLTRLEATLEGRRHHDHGSNFDNFRADRRDRLRDWRGELTWGDLAAMILATRAGEIPQVVEHLFDFAERDRLDETTEYGGVIALDDRGRFEIREFPPRIRHHDQKFIASQAMLDAAYTSLFHFHLHAQRHHNRDYAGPGFGDVNYADNTRANCLVLTFIDEAVMNVDYYRHGRVLVDLGEIRRP